jgi:transcriptional pleiotropic repressor
LESAILSKMRKLNTILQTSGATHLSFKDLCTTIMNILDSNVYVVSKRGKILGVSLYDRDDSAVVLTDGGEHFYNSEEQAQLLKINETLFNITEDKLIEFLKTIRQLFQVCDDCPCYWKCATTRDLYHR